VVHGVKLVTPDNAQATPGRTSLYAQHDLCFHLQVYHDFSLGRRCLARLRAVFPEARVLLISDGDDDPRWRDLALRNQAHYVRGERLYELARGGAIVRRMLELFLAQPGRWLIRIDTDTRLHRAFRWLPTGPCVFGTLEHRTVGHGEPLVPPCVQGGFMGFTREAATRLFSSGVFESPLLATDPLGTWADTHDTRERASHGRVSFDHLVRYGCRTVGLAVAEFDEVRSLWRGRIDNRGLRFAATHPHKLWWQWPGLTLSLWLARLGRRARAFLAARQA